MARPPLDVGFCRLVVFWTELANNLSSAPHLAVAKCLKFGIELFAIVGLAVGVDRALSFVAACYFVVKFFKHRLCSVVERTHPVEGTALSCC